MSIHKIFSFCVALCFSIFAYAQFSTPIIDGVIAAGEYGAHIEGENQITSNFNIWYMAWDDTNLYLAGNDPSPNRGRLAFFDINPIVPVNGGTNADGLISATATFNSATFDLPFRADFALYFDGDEQYFRTQSGNTWGAEQTAGLQVALGSFATEIAIPWSAITGGARPEAFNWLGYRNYEAPSNQSTNAVPVENENESAPNPSPYNVAPVYYYSITNTTAGGTTKPFAQKSICYYRDESAPASGGFTIENQALYDLTVNDNSANNNDNLPANHAVSNNGAANRVLLNETVTVRGDVYVGPGSAIFPANQNNTTDQLSLEGLASEMTVLGRIDCNPDFLSAAWQTDNRRLNLRIACPIVLDYNLPKEYFRIGNLQLTSNGELVAKDGSFGELTFQFGKLDNEGLIELGDGIDAGVDVEIRANTNIVNEYLFRGYGDFRFHSITIGEGGSRFGADSLFTGNNGMPPFIGDSIPVVVRGDFTNNYIFKSFSPNFENSFVSLRMQGSKRQYIRGKFGSTFNNKTTFHTLFINNNNGLNNDNFNADVYFETEGAGTIEYEIWQRLEMVSGDLVTRNRETDEVHKFVYNSPSAIGSFNCRSDDSVGTPSCYVDGPLTLLQGANQSNNTILTFTVGKRGNYRRVQMAAQQANENDIGEYKVELIDENAAFIGHALPTVPAQSSVEILQVNPNHYWRVENPSNNFTAGLMLLTYDSLRFDDAVIDSDLIAVVAAETGTSDPFVNVSENQTGNQNFVGGISTNGLPSMNLDIVLAYQQVLLPLEWLGISATQKDNEIAVDWSTATEYNVSHFEIERSTDNLHFEKIGDLEAIGFTESREDYQFVDSNYPDAKDLYYRVKQVDFDAKFDYSDVVSISPKATNTGIQVFPNPNDGVLNIRLFARTTGTFSVYNMAGQLMLREELSQDNLTTSVSHNLPQGVYQVVVETSFDQIVKKIVVR